MFSLVHPALFAAGIACIAIPIVIHLLRRKRKPISWGAMRFLEQAYRKRKRILTIEQLILLVIRCALVVLLSIGIGGLILGSGTRTNAPVALTIVLDNSIGSALLSDTGEPVLAHSKRTALDAIDQLNTARGDRAALITMSTPASALIMRPTTDLDAIRALIQSTASVDSGIDFEGAIELINAQDIPEESTLQSLLIASDFRAFTPDTITQSTGTTRFTRIAAPQPATEPTNNIGIAHITPSRELRLHESATTLPITITINLVRSGTLDATTTPITITDAASSETIAQSTHEWNPGETESTALLTIQAESLTTIRAGSAALIATITTSANPKDNPRDNSGACVIRLRQGLRLGVLESDPNPADRVAIRPSRALRAAISPNDSSPIDLSMLDPARLSSLRLAEMDAVFILSPNDLSTESWNTIAQANRNGLVVLITPQGSAPSANWTEALHSFAISDAPDSILPKSHPESVVLSETLPSVSLLAALTSEYGSLARSVRVSRSIDLAGFTNATPIANFHDGTPFVVQITHPTPAGSVILFATALDLSWTDLITRPLFVPMMQELIRQSVGRSTTRASITAGNPPADAGTFAIVQTPHTSFGTDASLGGALRNAGLYAPLDNDGAATAIIAVNPDAVGADTTPIPFETLDDQLTRSTGVNTIEWFTNGDSGNETDNQSPLPASIQSQFSFAGIVFLVAAAFGLIELILARIFSFRSQAQQAGSSA